MPRTKKFVRLMGDTIMSNTRQKGFTLVEILIVVVILGILAAIVIPQFSEASSEARVSSVKSNLQMVRSQIELYKIQHNDYLPGDNTSGGDSTFFEALTMKTDVDGTKNTAGDYGPYMQGFPRNALNELGDADDESEITIVSTGTRAEAAAFGWAWDTSNGDFYACDNVDIGKDLDETNDSWNW
jgi:general secretion pathway protein G